MLAGLAGPAAAHWLPPEAVVARLNSEPVRRRWGVERAERDAKAPRLLIVRVGKRWYELPAAIRKAEAGEWLGDWRHNVPQGVVAVLDAASDQPVVQFGPGGRILRVADPPRR